MMMQFHFGLGVGHVFSHYSSPQVEVPVTRGVSCVMEEAESGDEEEEGNSSESEKDDDCSPMVDCDEQFGSSTESLIGEFEEMYDSEVELDYKN
jgi:hypothetical protein